MGRELEKLNYYWFEEPLFDVDFTGLRKLSDKLDIPICGTEVLAGSHYSTAECIAKRVVDIVRTDVSWKGGVTPVMKTAHLAESFGVHCELHTTIYHPLEIVNLHCCAAIANCEFFEVLYPLSYMDFGMKTPDSSRRGRLCTRAGVAGNRSRLGLEFHREVHDENDVSGGICDKRFRADDEINLPVSALGFRMQVDAQRISAGHFFRDVDECGNPTPRPRTSTRSSPRRIAVHPPLQTRSVDPAERDGVPQPLQALKTACATCYRPRKAFLQNYPSIRVPGAGVRSCCRQQL